MTKGAKVNLSVPREIHRTIKSEAKRLFPKEVFAFLLGTVAGDSVHVDEIYVPPDVAEHTTCMSVDPQPYWWTDAAEQARESDLCIVGWYHSHPYSMKERARRNGKLFLDHAPSEKDLDCQFRLMISAVCVVQEVTCRGRLTLRASVRYWGCTIPVEVSHS